MVEIADIVVMSGGIGRLVSELALGNDGFVDSSHHQMDHFGVIDPLDPAFIQHYADTRSGKITG